MVRNIIVVKMDKYGKVFLPKQIRSRIDADRFEAVFVKNELHLKPIRKPTELFGILPDINNKNLDEVHNEEHELPG